MESYWDYLPLEIQDVIYKLAQRELMKDVMKQIRDQEYWISNDDYHWIKIKGQTIKYERYKHHISLFRMAKSYRRYFYSYNDIYHTKMRYALNESSFNKLIVSNQILL